MTSILRYVILAIIVISAAYLAYYGKDGWGWFIFLALMIGG